MALRKIAPVTTTASGTGWTVRKTGNLVELRVKGLTSEQAIPPEFAPSEMTYTPVYAKIETPNYPPRVGISASGTITPLGCASPAYALITYTV